MSERMTNEEAKKRLEVRLICANCPEDKMCYDSHLHSICEYTDYCDEVSIEEAVKVAIEVLGQKTCEDAISRQAVIDATVKKNSIWNSITNSKGENLEEIISQLPPVTSELKSGHWIDVTNKHGTVIAAKCSCCKNYPKHAIKSIFCPNCGAKMTEGGTE